MSIDKAISQAIQDNLPAATTRELNKYLTQAKENEAELNKRMELIKKQSDEIVELRDKLEAYKKKESKYSELSIRERQIEKRENTLEVKIAQEAVVQAEKRANGIHQLAETVFRNRSMTREVVGSAPTPNAHGGYPTQPTYETHRNVEVED